MQTIAGGTQGGSPPEPIPPEPPLDPYDVSNIAVDISYVKYQVSSSPARYNWDTRITITNVNVNDSSVVSSLKATYDVINTNASVLIASASIDLDPLSPTTAKNQRIVNGSSSGSSDHWGEENVTITAYAADGTVIQVLYPPANNEEA